MRHTPGNWEAGVAVRGQAIEITCDGQTIGQAIPDCPLIEVAANARIMALAPRMLEVLKKIVPDEMTFSSAPGHLKEARQILKEANAYAPQS